MRAISGWIGLTLAMVFAAPGVAADALAPPARLNDAARKVLCRDALDSPRFVRAESTSRPKPRFPRDDLNEWSEGWVLMAYSIGEDGVPKDVEVLDRLGSKEIVTAAVGALKRWRYRPAKFDGKPVEQFNNALEIFYRFKGDPIGSVHQAVARKHERGRKLLNGGDVAGAVAELESAFTLRLNLYEQSRLLFLLAIANLRSNNAARALHYIRHATLSEGEFLEKDVAAAAWRQLLLLEALDSDFHFVACNATLLKKDDAGDAAADREEVLTVAGRVEAALANPAPLVLAATLAVNGWVEGAAVWEHPLIRRKFGFDRTNGKVKTFKLSCFTQIVEGKVDDTSQWSVPVSAGPCMLRVYGEAGATFVLIEEW